MLVLVIQSNTVIQIVVSNSISDVQNTFPTYTVVPAPDPDPQLVGVGFVTNDGGNTFQFPVSTPPSPVWAVTRFAMMGRFTANEAIGIHMASQGTGQNAATMQYFLNALNIAEYIDLQSNTTIQMVGELVQFGILTQDRANTILQTPAAPNEKVT